MKKTQTDFVRLPDGTVQILYLYPDGTIRCVVCS